MTERLFQETLNGKGHKGHKWQKCQTLMNKNIFHRADGESVVSNRGSLWIVVTMSGSRVALTIKSDFISKGSLSTCVLITSYDG